MPGNSPAHAHDRMANREIEELTQENGFTLDEVEGKMRELLAEDEARSDNLENYE